MKKGERKYCNKVKGWVLVGVGCCGVVGGGVARGSDCQHTWLYHFSISGHGGDEAKGCVCEGNHRHLGTDMVVGIVPGMKG
jgi:hypothetical protein